MVVDPTDQICLDFMHFFAQQYVQESSQPINAKSCKYSQYLQLWLGVSDENSSYLRVGGQIVAVEGFP